MKYLQIDQYIYIADHRRDLIMRLLHYNTLEFKNLYNISGSFMGICFYEYFNDVTTNRKPIVTKYNFK
jgi:hypothetical protein